MVKAGKGFRAAEISFIAKVLVAMGAKRMKELNDATYGGYVTSGTSSSPR